MATREEIREGVAEVMASIDGYEWETLADNLKSIYLQNASVLVHKLHYMGVVIKVDRDSMPPFYCQINMDKVALSGGTAFIEVPELEKAGYVYTVPLIVQPKGEQDD